MRTCTACNSHINITELLKCSGGGCAGQYHFTCVGINEGEYKTQKEELELHWKCPECLGVTQRRLRNYDDHTPIRQSLNASIAKSSKEMNKTESNPYDDTNMSINEHALNDKSVLGNTAFLDMTSPPNSKDVNIVISPSVTLEQIGTLFDQKLRNNTIYLLQKIEDMNLKIREEFNHAIKKLENEIKTSEEKHKIQQQILKNQIENITKQICELETKNHTLQQQIKDLNHTNKPSMPTQTNDCKRKIVVYGWKNIMEKTNMSYMTAS
ncbi:hypothetical protein O0L34_g8297 [Tuta absoluta]|nr:hypothetical protein O0L34_g8297 [Tuta absoluta]